MKSNKFKILICVALVLLIIAVNCITVLKIIDLNRNNQQKVVGNFGQPSDIVVRYAENYNTLQQGHVGYEDILNSVEKTYGYLQTFSYIDPIQLTDTNQLWLEYKYSEKQIFEFSVNANKKVVASNRICIIITGKDSGAVCIDTDDGQLTLGILNFSSDAVNQIKNALLNAPRIE